MTEDELKRSAAEAAIAYITPKLTTKSIVGVGTGSTTNHFIDGLRDIRHLFDATVSSSEASSQRLRDHALVPASPTARKYSTMRGPHRDAMSSLSSTTLPSMLTVLTRLTLSTR